MMLSPAVFGQRCGLCGTQTTRIDAYKVIDWQRRWAFKRDGMGSFRALLSGYCVVRFGFDLFLRQRSEQYLT